MEDIYGRGDIYNKELVRLERSPITISNKEHLLRFHQHLFSENIKALRVVKLSCQLRKLGERIEDKNFEDLEESDIRALVGKINGMQDIAEYTKSDYRKTIKQFFKWLQGNNKHYPPKVDWIKVAVKQNGQSKFDLVKVEEIKKVIETCTSDRDRAFVSLIYESGGRIAELLTMKVCDVENFQTYGKISLSGKTGRRRILISSSLPHLNRYLSLHPQREDPHAPLWLVFGPNRKYTSLQYQGARDLLRTAFDRAGVKKKRLHPHLMRHSRATELSVILTEAQMRQFFGWTSGSDMPSDYVHLSGRDCDSAMMVYNGLATPKDNQKEKLPTNIQCPRCSTVNSSLSKYCSICSMALRLDVAMEAEQLTKQETDNTFKLLMEVMGNPELKKSFEAFKAQMVRP